MNKLLTYSMFLLMLLSVSLLVVPNAVHASPGPGQLGQASPTADNDSTNQTVTDPGKASWDSNNGTSADFTFGTAAGTFVVYTFNSTYLLGYTAYLTSGTFTVNGLTAYAIQGSQTAAQLSRTFTSTTTAASWGIRVWKRTSGGVETEITAGAPVATVSRSATASGTLSATWACPRTSLATTDAIVVRVYIGSGTAPTDWTLKETFISFQLDATQLDARTWTVWYWAGFSTTTKIAEYRFGDATSKSQIVNVVYNKLPTTAISQVDLKIRYNTTLSTNTGHRYRIYYIVSPSTTIQILKDWSRDATTLDTYVWLNKPEPNDNVWSWSDVANLRVIFETKKASGSVGSEGRINEYEVWATVSTTDASVYVDPASTTGLPIGSKFNISIEASDFCHLYGWEFKLGFDNTILNVFRGPLPPKYALNYYIWKNETETNTDIGNTLIAFAANEKHTENVTVNGIFDPNEFMYRDLDNSGRVSVNDVRLTAVGSYAAGSTVAGGDTDIDWGLIAFTANEKHRENIAVNAQFDPGEFMYRDTDVNGIVSNTDVRLTAVGSYPAGSTITAANQVWFSAQVPMGTPATSAPSGGGTLTIITFIVTGVGTTTLALSGTKMGDGNGLPIAHTVTNGSFSNVGVLEFPLGAALEIAIPVVLVFLWWTKRQKKIKPRSASTALPTLKA